MQVGPFPKRDIEAISKLLQEAGIPFEVSVDDAAAEAALQTVKNRLPTSHPDQAIDPATHLFEIPDEKLAELGNLLEPFGVSLASDPDEPDFSHEDYYCPECRHHATSPGSCPKHGVVLLTYAQRVQHEAEREKAMAGKRLLWIALAVCAGAGVFYFLT